MTNLSKILSAFIMQTISIADNSSNDFYYENAIIENLYIENNIKNAQMLQHDIHSIGGTFGDRQLSPEDAFIYLNKIFTNANVFTDERFDKKNIEKLLSTEIDSEYFTEEDLQDLILFMRQKNNQEMVIDDKYYNKYIKNLKTLGLIDEIPLKKNNEYDYIWILGGTRSMMENRMQYFKKLIDKKKLSNKPVIIFLAGNREVYLEMDSIKEATVEENKSYFIEVAKKNNIIFNVEKPFVKYSENDVIPHGREKDRTYLNTIGRKLTETVVGEDIYEQIFGEKCKNVSDEIIVSGSRPTTKTTAIYTMKMMLSPNFSDKLKNKPVNILLISNNFYILRQLQDIKNVIKELFLSSQNNINNFNYEDFKFAATGSSYQFDEADLTDIKYEMKKLAVGQYKSLINGKIRKRSLIK